MDFGKGICTLIGILGVKRVIVKKAGVELLNGKDIPVGIIRQARKFDEVREIVEEKFPEVEVVESGCELSNLEENLSKMLKE